MKVTEKVYALEASKGAYVYVILGNEIILVDTGFSWAGKRILRELSAMDIKLTDIKHILLTHYDLDHIGNAAILARLTGAKLWASKEDKPYILGETQRPGFKKYLSYLFKSEKPTAISTYIEGKKIGGIEVVPTPGHTPGHVCLLFEDVIFAGDLVKCKKDRLIPYPSNWNWNTSVLKDSIRKLTQYTFKWICPAHGRPTERGKNTI